MNFRLSYDYDRIKDLFPWEQKENSWMTRAKLPEIIFEMIIWWNSVWGSSCLGKNNPNPNDDKTINKFQEKKKFFGDIQGTYSLHFTASQSNQILHRILFLVYSGWSFHNTKPERSIRKSLNKLAKLRDPSVAKWIIYSVTLLTINL